MNNITSLNSSLWGSSSAIADPPYWSQPNQNHSPILWLQGIWPVPCWFAFVISWCVLAYVMESEQHLQYFWFQFWEYWSGDDTIIGLFSSLHRSRTLRKTSWKIHYDASNTASSLHFRKGATLWEEIQEFFLFKWYGATTSVSWCNICVKLWPKELLPATKTYPNARAWFYYIGKNKQKKEHINPISNHCWLPRLFINTTLSWCIMVTLGAPEHNQGAASGSKNQRMALLWLVTVSKNTKMWPLYPYVGFEVCLF